MCDAEIKFFTTEEPYTHTCAVVRGKTILWESAPRSENEIDHEVAKAQSWMCEHCKTKCEEPA